MRLLRSSGRALRGFILRANLSRARMSFASRYSIPSSEPRAGLFICESYERCIIRGRRRVRQGRADDRADDPRGHDGSYRRFARPRRIPPKAPPKLLRTTKAMNAKISANPVMTAMPAGDLR